MQVGQNECISLCIKLNSKHHKGAKNSRNKMATNIKRNECAATRVSKYGKGTSSVYVNEVFIPSRNTYKTRSHMALEVTLRKINLGQKRI